jgi:hypothetical protein
LASLNSLKLSVSLYLLGDKEFGGEDAGLDPLEGQSLEVVGLEVREVLPAAG